jgi:hypothetical protein
MSKLRWRFAVASLAASAARCADTTLVIGVPGSGGTFARAPISALSSALSAKGYGTLAVVLAGMFANLPLKARPETAADEDAFRRQTDAALKAVRDGKEDQLLPLPMRRTRPAYRRSALLNVPLGSLEHGRRHVLDQTHPASDSHVARCCDTVIQPFEPEMLLSAANSEGSLVPNIKYVLLPNAKGPNPGGHSFSDTAQGLAEARRSPHRPSF